MIRWTFGQATAAVRGTARTHYGAAAAALCARRFVAAGADAATSKPKTGILMMNLGGPSNAEEVEPFLLRLFSDREIIQLPFQDYLGPMIAKRRTPKIIEQYNEIGGGSPIRTFTEQQGEMLSAKLDEICPETAPHKAYIGFRYAPPLTEDALQEMQRDGVERVVAFTQYPQYSCSTTGSSLNELYRQISKAGLVDRFKWSVIDRWHTHPGLVRAFAKRVREGLASYDKPEDVLLMFSAHSLPMRVVDRGDRYPAEVAETVGRVMDELGRKNRHCLVWQSKVGPLPWLGPQTGDALEGFGKRGIKDILVIPIAFTSDHIETLFEIDLEYGELAEKHGITGFRRCESLNTDPVFIDAMADLVSHHLQSGDACSRQMGLRCPSCVNDDCGRAKQFFAAQPM